MCVCVCTNLSILTNGVKAQYTLKIIKISAKMVWRLRKRESDMLACVCVIHYH